LLFLSKIIKPNGEENFEDRNNPPRVGCHRPEAEAEACGASREAGNEDGILETLKK
jgi:hypothetical protein